MHGSASRTQYVSSRCRRTTRGSATAAPPSSSTMPGGCAGSTGSSMPGADSRWGSTSPGTPTTLWVRRCSISSVTSAMRPTSSLRVARSTSTAQGTVLTTEECLLHGNRNPTLTREQIEGHLREYLECRDRIWLPRGVYLDETNGHVDNFARFVSPGHVMLTWTDDESRPAVRDQSMKRWRFSEGIRTPGVARSRSPWFTSLARSSSPMRGARCRPSAGGCNRGSRGSGWLAPM